MFIMILFKIPKIRYHKYSTRLKRVLCYVSIKLIFFKVCFSLVYFSTVSETFNTACKRHKICVLHQCFELASSCFEAVSHFSVLLIYYYPSTCGWKHKNVSCFGVIKRTKFYSLDLN